MQDFQYVDRQGVRWIAPKGDRLDGASIPKLLWGWLIGTPQIGPYFEASVLHDAYCYRKAANLPGKERNWSAIHRMFYEAMRCGGTGDFEAKTKYWAVQKFGPPKDRTIWQRFFGSPDVLLSSGVQRGAAGYVLSQSFAVLSDTEVAAFFAGMTEQPDRAHQGGVQFQAPAGAQLAAATKLAALMEERHVHSGGGSGTQVGDVRAWAKWGSARDNDGGTASRQPAEWSRVEVKPESFLSGPAFLTTETQEQRELMETVIYISQRSDQLSLDDLDRLASEGIPEKQ